MLQKPRQTKDSEVLVLGIARSTLRSKMKTNWTSEAKALVIISSEERIPLILI